MYCIFNGLYSFVHSIHLHCFMWTAPVHSPEAVRCTYTCHGQELEILDWPNDRKAKIPKIRFPTKPSLDGTYRDCPIWLVIWDIRWPASSAGRLMLYWLGENSIYGLPHPQYWHLLLWSCIMKFTFPRTRVSGQRHLRLSSRYLRRVEDLIHTSFTLTTQSVLGVI